MAQMRARINCQMPWNLTQLSHLEQLRPTQCGKKVKITSRVCATLLNFNSALTVHVNRQLTLTLFRNVSKDTVQQRWLIVPAIYIIRVSFQGDVIANTPCHNAWPPQVFRKS